MRPVLPSEVPSVKYRQRDQPEIISPALENIPLSQNHIPGAKEQSHLCGKGAARRGDAQRGTRAASGDACREVEIGR